MVDEVTASYDRSRHQFGVFLVFAVIALIAVGALVTSKGAGLSVPDWPLSYGTLNPPQWWEIENVRAEHGHRLFAGLVALLTVTLAIWTWRRESRGWVRGLSYAAVAVVLLQAVLGGVTVLLFLPTSVSVGHAGIAEVFLGLIVTLAVVTSRWWLGDWSGEGARELQFGGIRRVAVCLSAVVYCQILIGAVMRHSGAGLAIPDFPLAFGRLIPRDWSFAIAVHYAHRVGAGVVAAMILVVFVLVLRRARAVRPLLVPSLLLVVLVCTQVALGGAVVLTGKAVLPNTIHVGMGASIWAMSLVLALNAARISWLESRSDRVSLGESIS
jgi:cytochrome c oxidase assembly protein subunit 15